VVVSDELGALGVIADRMRAQDIAQIADVDALDRLAEDASGQETLTILDALCRTGSARKAATALFRHHSTVLTRITHAESQLGFAFGSPAGRIRLELALILRRLRNTAEQDHAN
jgi:DNA-binding PucR family transcriptional regulator